jgi:hypothetical protein
LIYGCTHPGSIKPDEFTGKPDYRDKSFASELKDFIPVYANITRDNISIDQSFFLSHFILNTWMMSSPGRVYVCFLAFLRVGVTMRMLCPAKAEAFSKKNDLFGALPSCISAPTLFVRPDIRKPAVPSWTDGHYECRRLFAECRCLHTPVCSTWFFGPGFFGVGLLHLGA